MKRIAVVVSIAVLLLGASCKAAGSRWAGEDEGSSRRGGPKKPAPEYAEKAALEKVRREIAELKKTLAAMPSRKDVAARVEESGKNTEQSLSELVESTARLSGEIEKLKKDVQDNAPDLTAKADKSQVSTLEQSISDLTVKLDELAGNLAKLMQDKPWEETGTPKNIIERILELEKKIGELEKQKE